MKTAISIPDSLFEAAEELARRSGLSRSELYAKALAEYVEKQRGEWITEQLNRVYATEDSAPDEFVKQIQAHSIPPEEW
ncbi:MAG TPA: CopG family transcriptional regulator [Planctomycetaceae bacterium]